MVRCCCRHLIVLVGVESAFPLDEQGLALLQLNIFSCAHAIALAPPDVSVRNLDAGEFDVTRVVC